MNFKKASESLEKIASANEREYFKRKSMMDIINEKRKAEFKEEVEDIITELEKFYEDTVESGLENAPSWITVSDYDNCLTFHDYSWIDDVTDDQHRTTNRVQNYHKANERVAKLLESTYSEFRDDFSREEIISDVLKEHNMRIRVNLHRSNLPSLHYCFRQVPDDFIVSEFDIDFMKDTSYIPLVITKGLEFCWDNFHDLVLTSLWQPIHGEKYAILYYQYLKDNGSTIASFAGLTEK